MFNIIEDEEECLDLREHEPAKLKTLLAALETANKTLYNPLVKQADVRCCAAAEARGGFIGPWLK